MTARPSVAVLATALCLTLPGPGAAHASEGRGTADAADGRALFQARCASCHTGPGDAPAARLGPPLAGVVGRQAGTDPGFTRYSKAMSAGGFAWTPDALDAFITAPRKRVPGTSMIFPGVPAAEDRRAIIRYLEEGGK